MGQFQAQSSVPSAAHGFPACAVADGAAELCFSFPTPSPGKPHSCSDLRSSAPLELPWAMIKPLSITQALTNPRDAPQAHTDVGTPASRVGLIAGSPLEFSPPVKATPPNPGAPPRWKGSESLGRSLGRGCCLRGAPVPGVFKSQGPWASPQISFCLRFLIHWLDREFNDRVVGRCDNN